MACYYPITGYKSRQLNSTGKRSIVFNSKFGFDDMPVVINCGRCVGCRLEYSRQWAMRCMHESQLYDDNCFLTLTYDDAHLPADCSLNMRDMQLFWKRLRKFYGKKLRYYMAGEYGSVTYRPHYHACVFGFRPDDLEIYTVRDDITLYTSAVLEDLWGHGFVTVGELNFETAAYTARYVMKKFKSSDEQAKIDHYRHVNYETGEFVDVVPEFVAMSRRPGIGRDWLSKFSADVYNHDFCVINGQKVRPPKFYDSVYELSDPDHFHLIQQARVTAGRDDSVQVNRTPERLDARRKVHEYRAKLLARTL
ncbi:MAG: replication associated protein [Microviridae sp. ct0DW36]|nr:MAG: replication associated protein [Microviridae sp. ct0DW36]